MLPVSVIVPTYNRGALLKDTLEKLLRCEGEAYEILVVDQSDTENEAVRQLAGGNQDKIRYYWTRNPGLPRARNYGIARARHPIVLFCDDDIIPAPAFIHAHARHYTDDSIGGVAGRVLPPDSNGTPPVSTGGRTGRISRFTGNQTDAFDALIADDVDHGQGCNISFRKRVLQKIGGFDSRFGGSAFLEETDVCLRVKGAGYRIRFDPDAAVVHLKDPTGGCRPRNPAQWYLWYGHNYILLLLKNLHWYTWPGFFLFRWVSIVAGTWRTQSPRLLLHGFRGMVAGVVSFRRGRQVAGDLISEE